MTAMSVSSWWLLGTGFLLIDGLLFCLGYWAGRLRGAAPGVQSVAAAAPAPAPAPVVAVPVEDPERLEGLEARLRRMESALRRVEVRPRFDPAPLQEGGAPMDVAARLARKGSSVEELMAVCNLGRGEAELIRVLYGSERAA